MSTQINLATLERLLSSAAAESFLSDDKWEPYRLQFLENPETSERMESAILAHDHTEPDPFEELLALASSPTMDTTPAAEPIETFGQKMARLKREKKANKPANAAKKQAAPAAEPAPKTYRYVAQTHRPKTAGNVVSGKAKSATVHTIGIAQLDDSGNVCNRIMLGRVQARLIVELARNPEQLAALDKLAAEPR